MKKVFVRDDDVYSIEEPFFKDFVETFLSKRIPVVYGVIPGLCDEKTCKALSLLEAKHPHLVITAQHGYMHKNNNPLGRPKYEFGTSAAFDLQLAWILEGRRILADLIGKPSDIFIPPYDEFDANTLKAVDAAGFSFFISSPTRMDISQFAVKYISCPITLNDYHNEGRPIPITIKEALMRLINIPHKKEDHFGILIHHSAYSNKTGLSNIKAMAKILSQLQEEGIIELSFAPQ